jgi:hypothetical protein
VIPIDLISETRMEFQAYPLPQQIEYSPTLKRLVYRNPDFIGYKRNFGTTVPAYSQETVCYWWRKENNVNGSLPGGHTIGGYYKGTVNPPKYSIWIEQDNFVAEVTINVLYWTLVERWGTNFAGEIRPLGGTNTRQVFSSNDLANDKIGIFAVNNSTGEYDEPNSRFLGIWCDSMVWLRLLSDTEKDALADPDNVDLRVPGGPPLILHERTFWPGFSFKAPQVFSRRSRSSRAGSRSSLV